MLEICNVVKSFGKETVAVQDVSMKLTKGVVGLIGHNGAGKTTLMQMIATLTRPNSGKILYHGVDIAKSPDDIRRRLGYLPQDFGVYPHLSALEFLQYFAALKGVRDPKRITELLELVHLTDHAKRPAANFSGGMRRRLGIAQALLNNPDVLVVDEPTAGLDPEERLHFRNLLCELGFSRLVIMSTHIVSDVETIASQLAIMRKGRLIALETPDAILDKAQGQVWSAHMTLSHFENLRRSVQVLHSQRRGEMVQVRMAHPKMPCQDAQLVEPNLEEALMAQRYALQEVAA